MIPEIDYIDCLNGRIYFKNHLNNYQIEVYKYNRKHRGEHLHRNGRVYEEHHGKRFISQMIIKKGQLYWEIPERCLTSQRRNYFKFAFLNNANGSRGSLTSFTLKTLNVTERYNLNSKFILI